MHTIPTSVCLAVFETKSWFKLLSHYYFYLSLLLFTVYLPMKLYFRVFSTVHEIDKNISAQLS